MGGASQSQTLNRSNSPSSNSPLNRSQNNGAMAAEPGCHDDTVMALALVNYVNDGKFTPVEVTSDMYIEMI